MYTLQFFSFDFDGAITQSALFKKNLHKSEIPTEKLDVSGSLRMSKAALHTQFCDWKKFNGGGWGVC
jgi:hypothetical protein